MTPDIDNLQAEKVSDDSVVHLGDVPYVQSPSLHNDMHFVPVEMTWTSKYPTQPGTYWMRNIILSAAPRCAPVLKPELVCLMPEPDGFLLLHRMRDSRQWCVGDFLSAEWFGPILPPGSTKTFSGQLYTWDGEPR